MNKIKTWANIAYDKNNKIHNALIFFVVAILIFACFTTQKKACETVFYPQEDIGWTSQYIKQFDAFKKGQLHIDIEPDAALNELENPYDTAARDESGANYLWDHAYYEGKYYSYFGIAPIFTVYYPFNFVFGSLPNDAFACLILAVYAIIFTALAFREVVLRFCEKPNIYLYLLGLIATVCASGVYLGVLCSDVYYIAVLSALGCAMAFTFFAFRAMRENSLPRRVVLLILCALSLVMTVLSRPTAAVMCVCVLPIFIQFLVQVKKETLTEGLITVGAFALPLLFGAVFVMWFNYARFGSPFDFGANYQLTVNDISQNNIEPAFFFSAIFSFFLCPLWRTKTFPFAQMQCKLVLPDGARYVYADSAVGALAYGLPCGILLYPAVMALDRKDGKKNYTKDAFVFLTVLLSIAIAFLDFCLAGVNMRYIYDITPMLSLAGAFILLNLQERTKGKVKAVMSILAAFLFAAAIYTNFCVVNTIATR